MFVAILACMTLTVCMMVICITGSKGISQALADSGSQDTGSQAATIDLATAQRKSGELPNMCEIMSQSLAGEDYLEAMGATSDDPTLPDLSRSVYDLPDVSVSYDDVYDNANILFEYDGASDGPAFSPGLALLLYNGGIGNACDLYETSGGTYTSTDSTYRLASLGDSDSPVEKIVFDYSFYGSTTYDTDRDDVIAILVALGFDESTITTDDESYAKCSPLTACLQIVDGGYSSASFGSDNIWCGSAKASDGSTVYIGISIASICTAARYDESGDMPAQILFRHRSDWISISFAKDDSFAIKTDDDWKSSTDPIPDSDVLLCENGSADTSTNTAGLSKVSAIRGYDTFPNMPAVAIRSWTDDAFTSAMQTDDNEMTGLDGQYLGLSYASAYLETDGEIRLWFEDGNTRTYSYSPTLAYLTHDGTLFATNGYRYLTSDQDLEPLTDNDGTFSKSTIDEAVRKNAFSESPTYSFGHDDAIALLGKLGFDESDLTTTDERYLKRSPSNLIATLASGAESPESCGAIYFWCGNMVTRDGITIYIRVSSYADNEGALCSAIGGINPEQMLFSGGNDSISIRCNTFSPYTVPEYDGWTDSSSPIDDSASTAAASTAATLGTSSVGNTAGIYKDGTYTGTGTGMGGKLNVTIQITDGVITVTDISPNNETKGIGGYEAIEDGTFANQIEEAQSADIEGVSGASITTAAIKKAVANALAQAAV